MYPVEVVRQISEVEGMITDIVRPMQIGKNGYPTFTSIFGRVL